MALELHKLHILLAEDTIPMRKLMISALEGLGIRSISVADDGNKAFEVFRRENPDIVITDWHMEPVSGIALARKIRSHPQSPNRMVPIILVTGYSAKARVAEARDSGVTEFLVKPFTAHDLARRITYVINKPRDFIETHDFFGPDRRRHKDPKYKGPYKRSEDANVTTSGGDIAYI